MAKRQVEWARRAREALVIQLGGKCAKCGIDYCLTFDHIDGCTYDTRQLGFTWRISVYRREASEGLLQLLCIWCNPSDGQRFKGKKRYEYGATPNGKRAVLHRPRETNG